MGDTLQQVALGGVVALLVLREVFSFLKNRRSNSEQSVESDQRRHIHKDIILEALDTAALPILRAQTEILARMESRSSAHYELAQRHGFILEQVDKSLDRLRTSNHDIRETLQTLVGGGTRRSESA